MEMRERPKGVKKGAVDGRSSSEGSVEKPDQDGKLSDELACL